MEFSSLQNSKFNIRIECDGYLHLNNVIDLYEREREKRIWSSYVQKAFQKKDFSKEIGKCNRALDYGDYEVSEDFLLFKQFHDYKIRLINWNEDDDDFEQVTVVIKIGIPNKDPGKLEDYMREFSRRILNKPLFVPSILKEDCVEVSPFEFKFDWNVGDTSIYEFSINTQFLSDKFENFLGHRTFLLFEFFHGKENLGRFAYKFFISKKDQRTVLLKRFVNPTLRPSYGAPIRGLHLQNANRKTKIMRAQEKSFLKLSTSTRYGLFLTRMNQKKVLHYASNGDIVFSFDFDKVNYMRIDRSNFFDPMKCTQVRIEINFETGMEESKGMKLKKRAFSVDFEKSVFPQCVLECIKEKQCFAITCEYPKYLDPEEFIVLALKFNGEAFKQVGLEKNIGCLNVTFYKGDSEYPLDQHFAWISWNASPSKEDLKLLDKQILKRHGTESSRKPLTDGVFNILTPFTIYGIFFLKITELQMSVPVYVYSNTSQAFIESIVNTYNHLYQRKIGKLLSFSIEDYEIYNDSTNSYRALAIPNKTFLDISYSEDLTSDIVVIDNEVIKYAGYKIFIVVDYLSMKKCSTEHKLVFKSVKSPTQVSQP